MTFRADLHCHSTFSDGTLTPQELLILAKEKGLSGISITDHDTIEAYTMDLFESAKKCDLRLLPGVEFSSTHLGMSVHILGYAFDIQNTELQNFCHRHENRREQRNKAILVKLARLGMHVTEEEIKKLGKGMIGRPHIAQILVEKGYVRSIQEAFDRFIADKAPCYVEGPVFSTEDTIKVIKNAGGKAFIAHPHLIEKKALLKELLKLPFDGIECYYSLFSADQEKHWLNIAKERGLLISGGSDFHGSVKPHIPLGCSWVDEDTFNQILS